MGHLQPLPCLPSSLSPSPASTHELLLICQPITGRTQADRGWGTQAQERLHISENQSHMTSRWDSSSLCCHWTSRAVTKIFFFSSATPSIPTLVKFCKYKPFNFKYTFLLRRVSDTHLPTCGSSQLLCCFLYLVSILRTTIWADVIICVFSKLVLKPQRTESHLSY